MTDTTFFIPTKAAFEHAFKVGAFTGSGVKWGEEAQADDWMYMHSSVVVSGRGSPGEWLDHFKHRDTRKYLKVRRTRHIEPDTVQAVARGPENNVADDRARYKRIAKMAQARAHGPQLLKALVNLYGETSAPLSVSHDTWLAARKEAKAAIEAAGWTPGEEG